jgi:NDP-sugar pyrophosphorylase family protein
MKGILICPGERSAVGFLAGTGPLVNLMILGEPLIGYWLQEFAGAGIRQVLILATDRPEQVRETVGTGARWGVQVEVVAELTEMSVPAAREKYGGREREAGANSSRVEMVDHLPGMPQYPLFTNYADGFAAAQAWLQRVGQTVRIGLKEIQPGVWMGLRSQAAPSVRFHAPCWIGEDVHIGKEAVIGPNAILENGVVVEAHTEIAGSWIGPETYVGELIRINDSLAWGSTLIDWQTSSCTVVPDEFLLCPLKQNRFGRSSGKDLKWKIFSGLARPWGAVKQRLGK